MFDKRRIIYLAAFIAFTYVGLKFFESSYVAKEINENGIIKQVEVASVPNCGRSINTMYVEYEKRKYNINIGKNDCIDGKYKMGDQIKVLYSLKYDKMQLPAKRANLLYWMSLFFFLLPLYCLFQIIRPFNK